MAHFIEQYIHSINRCDDYDLLACELSLCIRKNIVNHVSTNIKEAIDRLNLNTPYYKFMKSLVWAATASDHTETSLNLLRYFCNKITKDYDALTLEPDEFSLMVITICADDKHFLNKVPDDRKFELYNTLARWYLVRTKDDMVDPFLRQSILASMNLILNGKITMQELDFEMKKIYGDINVADIGTDKAHQVNELIRPFQALFINITQNTDQLNLLNQISFTEWYDRIHEEIQNKAHLYEKKFTSKNSYESYYVFLNDMIWGFKSLNDNLSKTGYSNIENPVVGEYLLNFLRVIHQAYSEYNLSTNEIAIMLRDAYQIYYNSFAVQDTVKSLIYSIIGSYCQSGIHEEIFVQGEYLVAIKSFLQQDEAFKLWASTQYIRDSQVFNLSDRVIATYANCYIKNTLDIEFDSEPVVVTEAKSNKDEYLNEADNIEDESHYDGPKIEATQSTKGYSRSSKKQADAERRIYGAYKNYKNNEAKVDSQLTKMLAAAKRAFTPDKTEEIIEGKKFTPIGLLKKILITGAIFNYSKIAGFAYLLVSHTISKKRTVKQKREILLQIETELKMMDEKIEDARSDGNRKAKYALMRTKGELERARDKIKYNLTATKEDMRVARRYINNDKRDNL